MFASVAEARCLEPTPERRSLATAVTPALVLDRGIAARNMARMRGAIGAANPRTRLRPHLKTAKSIAVARMLFDGGTGPITVSTLREAETFGAAGFTDILYAVGLSPDKIARAQAIRRDGINLKVVTDSIAAARAIAAEAEPLPTFIEIDVDTHRAGIRYDDGDAIRATADALAASLAGVMTHAGGSYALSDPAALHAAAATEAERARVAAQNLVGHGPLTVSIGSTPTALSAIDLTGIDEVRAGVYMFFDLVMAGVGVCDTDEIALSVLATVIGAYPERGQAIVDAGWMAMSRDRGTAGQRVDQGYGLVQTAAGRPSDDLVLIQASQEHGIVARRLRDSTPLALAVGDRVRILPNHACATAAQHGRYLVVDGNTEIVDEWERFNGW